MSSPFHRPAGSILTLVRHDTGKPAASRVRATRRRRVLTVHEVEVPMTLCLQTTQS